jgi:hypothetical protein
MRIERGKQRWVERLRGTMRRERGQGLAGEMRVWPWNHPSQTRYSIFFLFFFFFFGFFVLIFFF